jgi:dTDP-4-dehydrorhamnose 3,5-epimerase
MIFCTTPIPNVVELKLEERCDERGFFARTWCQQEFEDHGLNSRLVQCSISSNRRRGTLRGMHYQSSPHAEAKLVRCTKGSVFDVVLDLRPTSPTYKKWHSVVLTADAHNMIYVPEGCAHGFLTLADDSEILYQMSEFYHPESAQGVRWNDPAFQIAWPSEAELISERDRSYPDFDK